MIEDILNLALISFVRIS